MEINQDFRFDQKCFKTIDSEQRLNWTMEPYEMRQVNFVGVPTFPWNLLHPSWKYNSSLNIKAVSPCETLAAICKTTRRHIW